MTFLRASLAFSIALGACADDHGVPDHAGGGVHREASASDADSAVDAAVDAHDADSPDADMGTPCQVDAQVSCRSNASPAELTLAGDTPYGSASATSLTVSYDDRFGPLCQRDLRQRDPAT